SRPQHPGRRRGPRTHRGAASQVPRRGPARHGRVPGADRALLRGEDARAARRAREGPASSRTGALARAACTVAPASVPAHPTPDRAGRPCGGNATSFLLAVGTARVPRPEDELVATRAVLRRPAARTGRLDLIPPRAAT